MTQPTPIIESRFHDRSGRLSPDAKFLAYVSDETGREEVYVQRVEGMRAAGARRRVSVDGGTHPLWRRDGGELFFLSQGRLMASAVRRTGDALESASPIPLFALAVRSPTSSQHYAVTPDGQRFLAIIRRTVIGPATQPVAMPPMLGEIAARSATVRLNWAAGLQR